MSEDSVQNASRNINTSSSEEISDNETAELLVDVSQQRDRNRCPPAWIQSGDWELS